MYNILTEQLIRYDKSSGGRAEASLPEVYAALMADRVDAFPALRPHQRHAWHAFLVQLGAMAMHRDGLSEPPEEVDEWLRIIRALTPDFPGDEPWHLVVDEITRPAFMQPPATSKEREADYKSEVTTPDELDILITSKNHDIKSEVAAQAEVDDWIFALITLQTMEGFSGAGNYGIVRMNGGMGNRPGFSLALARPGSGAHVRRDIEAILEYLPTLLDEYPMIEGGTALLWTTTWDGTDSLLINRLNPLFIEVCRRIRFREVGRLTAIRATSKSARIDGKGLNGRTGDPWTPVARPGSGAHVRRDIEAILEYLPTLLDEYPMIEGGTALLWTTTWDGTDSLLINRLNPFFIEVCRRIRFREVGQLTAIRATSKSARIDGKGLNGRTGDPWTPVNVKEGKSLTLAVGGFTYKRITEYLTEWERPALLRPTRTEQRSTENMRLVARAMVRGQGKSEGYYERSVVLRPKTFQGFGRTGGVQELGELARQRIEQVGIVQRILSHAIQVFAARGDSDKVSPEHRALTRPWLNRLDGIVDSDFFGDLQTEFEADESERQGIRNQWLLNGKDGVVNHARALFHDAADSLPCPSIHRFKARANAEGLFEGRMRGNGGLPFLFNTED